MSFVNRPESVEESLLLSAEDAERLSSLLSLIADPVRFRILYALEFCPEMGVGDLAETLNVSEDSASYALKLLRTAGLVRNRRDGRIIYYRLADGFPKPLLKHCLRHLVALSRVAEELEDVL